MLALWLDDEPEMVQPQMERLRASGVEVITCTSVNDAVQALETGRAFDTVITDLMLPTDNGKAVRNFGAAFAEKVRRHLPTARIAAYSSFLPTMDAGETAVFDRVFSKSDFTSSNTLLSFVQDSISDEIAKSEGLDRDFVEDILKNRDFKIVSDVEIDSTLLDNRIRNRCVEVSYQINDTILRQAGSNPDLLWQLDDRRFEEICATILCREGFHVHLTSKSNDGGYDLLAFRHDGFLTALYLVECKRWDPRRKRVGVPIVRQLNGVVEHMSAHGGVLMATTEFTVPAQGFAREPSVRIDLVDFMKLRAWMSKVTT